MKRTTVIFEGPVIGSKTLYSGFLWVEKIRIFISRPEFRVLGLFEILRKSTCKIKIFTRTRYHFLMPICSLDINSECIEGFKPKGQRGQLRWNLKFRSKNSFLMTHIIWHQIGLSDENFSDNVILQDKNIGSVSFY